MPRHSVVERSSCVCHGRQDLDVMRLCEGCDGVSSRSFKLAVRRCIALTRRKKQPSYARLILELNKR